MPRPAEGGGPPSGARVSRGTSRCFGPSAEDPVYSEAFERAVQVIEEGETLRVSPSSATEAWFQPYYFLGAGLLPGLLGCAGFGAPGFAIWFTSFPKMRCCIVNGQLYLRSGGSPALPSLRLGTILIRWPSFL